jgi:hypothetical protein
LSSAGTEKVTEKQRWGYMTNGRSADVDDGNNVTPAYYVTSNSDFTELVNMTPELKTYLKYGPWGVHEDTGLLLEWPLHVWPILG